ncbi:A/G-specific adenine glycosylase [Paracidobacterium acidisoli]|uniref:Adenine DNA glycosylase n=1 Tax=Paracidobacterium acidisoli TaxID=2303751 RepID=A0A372IMC6_9BACT|nr:A/G-specific adenine glycosylase [Paracidobacterium acidisoli]MBT9332512.1 A/G-specific adenine glycosylase [Paracidobacterium acidisoli]
MESGPGVDEFRRGLLAWYGENARDLPWRRTADPWAIWVSEIMLQQTRVAAVLEYYTRFMERFPNAAALAEADEAEVLAHWSGLGYYRRARMLHQAAKQIMAHGGQIPRTVTGLRELPGVGEYTAAAIASIAFGEAAAVVDGNVERVLIRYMGQSEEEESRALKTRIQEEAARLLDPERPADFNQAMMELGATMCLPRGPLCLGCPVQEGCATRGEHVTAPAKKMRSREMAYGLFRRKAWPKTEVLLEQRPADASLMAGMWELPEIEAKTAQEDAPALTVRHSITNTNYYVSVFVLNAQQSRELAGTENTREWIAARMLMEMPLTGLSRKILKRLKVMPGYDGPGPLHALEESTDRIVL